MHNPLISVALSVYNGEKYLKEAIDSILNQSYKNFEFIIIDDGSTDDSLCIIESYKDERIISISRENKGLVASLNEAIRQSKGKYIIRMDADDISLSHRFQTQVDFMEANPQIGISGSYVMFFGLDIKASVWKMPSSDSEIKNELLFSSPFAHPSVILNRKIISQYNMAYDKNFLHAEDFELWTRVAKVTQMANISEVLLKYRVLKNSVTREANKNIQQRYEIHKKIFNTYLKQLGIQNTEEENRIHFNISLNKRVKENQVDFNQLVKYFDKLLKANSTKKVFDMFEMKKVLGKRWIVNIYYRKKFSKIFSKYFLYGMVGFIYKWIK